MSVTVAYAVSWLSAFCCASIDSRSDSCESIWFCTESSELTSPACLSSAAELGDRRLVGGDPAAHVGDLLGDVLRLLRSESWVPSPPPDSAASVAA